MLTVAIVGRPNVGKSRLFNRLIGRRHAIVEGTPGITRDRIECVVDHNGRTVRWIDTGGIGMDDPLGKMIALQAEVAMEAADLILLVVDAQTGIVTLDREIAQKLRGKKPVIVAVNKVDGAALDDAWTDFLPLGFQELFPISAEHGRRVNDLLDHILARGGDLASEESEEPVTRVAIVGRPNTGKSSLLNAILGEERVIVSNIPGTTRDAIEDIVELPHGKVALVDTAGIRKRRRQYSLLESVMVHRTNDAVGRSDVAILMTDAVEGVTDQDAKILQAIFAQGKGAVLALNKWDAVEEKAFDRIVRNVRHRLGSEAHVPIVSISALKGLRVHKLLETALEVGKNSHHRIKTSDLNQLLVRMSDQAPRGIKIKYGIQKTMAPPTFLLFGLRKPPGTFVHALKKAIREAGRFAGQPIVLEFKK